MSYGIAIRNWNVVFAVILSSPEEKHSENHCRTEQSKPADEHVIDSLHSNYLASGPTYDEPLSLTQGG